MSNEHETDLRNATPLYPLSYRPGWGEMDSNHQPRVCKTR